jgi:hypothetical protein
LPVASSSEADRNVPEFLETTLQNLALGEKAVQAENPSQAEKENKHVNAFESDPLSNPALSWGAPQNNLQWATPITLKSNTVEKTASPVRPLTPKAPQEQQKPLVAEEQPQMVPQQTQIALEEPSLALQQPQPPLTPRKAPVFPSSGFIPFAPSADIPIASIEHPSGSSTVESGDDNCSGTTQEGDIWDVPFTPAK